MKKMSGFCESLVSSQFLFHQSRYCSLFAPFPSLPIPSIIDHASKTTLPSTQKDIKFHEEKNLEQADTKPLRRILNPWEETECLQVGRVGAKKMVFVVTPILSSASIPRFHFLPSHSHFLSRLLVMLLYQANIGQDIYEQ